MSDSSLPLFLAAAALLVVAGVPKVADPKPLVRAVKTAGLPLGRPLVQAFALAEVVVGLGAIVCPGRVTGVLVAAMYLLFSAFVGVALARGGVLESCGCFGKADTPPTRSHLFVTLLLAAGGLAAAVVPPEATWWSHSPGSVGATVALAALVALLAWGVMAVLPTATAEAARSTGSSEPGGRTTPKTRGNQSRTFAIKHSGPSPLPDPTFPQKG